MYLEKKKFKKNKNILYLLILKNIFKFIIILLLIIDNKAGRRQGAIKTEGESDDPNYISMFQCNVYLYEKVHVYECVEHGGYGMKLVFYFFNKLLVKVIQKMNTRECRSERTFLSSEQAFCRYKRTVYSRRRSKMIHVYTNVQMCIIK